MKQQFVVIAHDAKDDKALDRRMAARPAHLENMKRLKDEGSYIHGGAMLNNSGEMIGSIVIVAFKNRFDLDAWLSREPYVIHLVWHEVDIKPFKTAPIE